MAQSPPPADINQIWADPGKYLLDHAEEVWGLIMEHSPLLSALIILTVTLTILAVRGYYKKQLNDRDERIQLREDQLRQREEEVKELKEQSLSTNTKQQERLEELYTGIAELQIKLATIEDTQPRLKAEVILVRRQLDYRQQPPQDHLGRPHHRGGLGFFALLRITNDPESKSSRAMTNNLRARISYHDENYRALFPSITGAWGDPDHKQQNGTIGDFSSDVSSVLRPQESIHLGIALRYPWDGLLACYAFNASSRRHPDWLHPELRLSGETIHVKVLITGDGIKELYLCRLKDCGPEKGLQFELIPSTS